MPSLDTQQNVRLYVSDLFDGGCDGGVPIYAYWAVKEAGGIELDSDYPYSSNTIANGECEQDSDNYVVMRVDRSSCAVVIIILCTA